MCFQIKQLTEFYKAKLIKTGINVIVKIVIAIAKKYYNENKENIYDNKKTYYEQNKGKQKEYYEHNKHKIDEQTKEWSLLNKDKINELNRNYHNNQINNNPIYRLITNNRSRIHLSLKSNSKANISIDLLGCSREFF